MTSPELFTYVKQRVSKIENRFYVYIHRRASDNKIYYVGKGSGSRAWNFHKRNKFWHNVHNKHGTIVEIVFDNLMEDESLQVEIDTILEFTYFGYNLVNQSSGGESPVVTEQTRKRMSDSRKGKPLSDAHKQSLRLAFLGKPRPDLKGRVVDNNTYHFLRLKDGEEFIGTRSGFCARYDKTPAGIRTLFQKSRPGKSYHGWTIVKD